MLLRFPDVSDQFNPRNRFDPDFTCKLPEKFQFLISNRKDLNPDKNTFVKDVFNLIILNFKNQNAQFEYISN